MVKIRTPLDCVVDASVALTLFFEQPGFDKAIQLFDRIRLETQIKYFVPDSFYAECAGSFIKQTRRVQGYSIANARADLTDLMDLNLKVISSAELAADAFEIALSHNISGYDAFYVELSRRVKATLITADAKLLRALSGKDFDFCFLNDL